MLDLLHIENIAVIEGAEIAFRPGFNALTGETGAGKSIVVDALGAVLGGRTSRELIRTGAEKAAVSAVFSGVAPGPALAGAGVEPEEDGTLLVRRELFSDGRNVCRANGRLITVTQLRAVGLELLNIHGQHDGQQLLDEERHGSYLDRFGALDGPLDAYRADYAALAELDRRIAALRMDEAEKARRTDALRFQIDELERAELRPGEEEELASRRLLLRGGEKYLASLSGADLCLSGDDETPGAVACLRDAEEAVRTVQSLDADLPELRKRLEQARCEVYDLAETIRDKRLGFDFSPEELDQAEARGDQLHRLGKKYGATAEDMLEYLDRSRTELDALQTAGDTLAALEKERRGAEARVLSDGAVLTAGRREAAARLERRITAELADLDMGKVRFAVEFTERRPPGPDGLDGLRFLLSANAGEALKPLSRVASGGELARIMLALKNVLAERDGIATLVFDEVDAGVSGRAARKVAEKLAQVSRRRQVLCVTHLPQLAAMADAHFSVEKGERKGRTFTDVAELDRERRLAELARLIGGARVTEAQLCSAAELLDEAAAYRASLESPEA